MSKRTKLSLGELKVDSFVTELDFDAKDDVRGGATFDACSTANCSGHPCLPCEKDQIQ